VIEFLIAPNPGEPERPLARIASGGEAARIMLAIKAILAHADRTPILIFDEIDSGVSGRTALRVAEKMHGLANGRQVFCITHLPQIAAMADHHFLIEKVVADEQTHVKIHCLDETGRLQEMARLLSGDAGTGQALSLAQEMLRSAAVFRQQSSN
jgi:DNA repair protein RecN (Recombination protein N)